MFLYSFCRTSGPIVSDEKETASGKNSMVNASPQLVSRENILLSCMGAVNKFSVSQAFRFPGFESKAISGVDYDSSILPSGPSGHLTLLVETRHIFWSKELPCTCTK